MSIASRVGLAPKEDSIAKDVGLDKSKSDAISPGTPIGSGKDGGTIVYDPKSSSGGREVDMSSSSEYTKPRSSSRSSRSSKSSSSKVVKEVPEPTPPKEPDMSSRQDVDRFNREVDRYNRDLKAYQSQFTRPDGFKPGESLYLEIGRDGLKDDVLVKDEDGSTLRRSGLSIDAKKFEEDIEKEKKRVQDAKLKDAKDSFRSAREASKPDPNKQLFGSREPGKETISDKPNYKVYDPNTIVLSPTQTAEFLAVRTFLPKYWGITKEEYKRDVFGRGSPARFLSDTGDKMISEFKGLRWEDRMRPKGFVEGQSLTVGALSAIGNQKASDFYKEREASWMSLTDKTGRVLTKGASVVGQVVGESVKDPVSDVVLFGVGGVVGKTAKVLKPVAVRYSAFVGSRSVPVRSALKGAGIGLKTSAVGVIGGSVVMDVAKADDPALRTAQIIKDFALLGAGFKAGQKTTIKFPSFKKTQDLTYKATGGEWRLKTKVQGRNIQTTLSGETITQKQIYETRLSAGVDPLKKSPLGIDDFYKSQIKPSKGSVFRLDESFSFTQTSLTESGKPIITGTGTIGPKTKPLIDPIQRLVDIRTGKEYNVPSKFVERRLLENTNLQVIGKTQQNKFLFSTDPITALAMQVKPTSFSITPSLSSPSQSPSPVTILKPKPVMSPSLQPLLITPILLTRQNDSVVGVVEEQQRQRQESSLSITPVLLSQRKNIDFMSAATLTETTTKNDLITSPRSITRSSSKSMIDTVQTPISETITQQVQSSAKIPKNILRQPRFNFQDIKSSSLTRPSLGGPGSGREPSLGAGFVVSVRRGGVFSPVGFFSSPAEAFSKGQSVVGGTAGASFKVSDPKGQVIPTSSFNLGSRFRPSKKERGVVVERRKYRISSPGELEEITYKGLMAQRTKRGRGGFNLF